MAGTLIADIKDFRDVVRLLEEHPEWRADLRRLILTEDLLRLPEQVVRLTEQVAVLTAAQMRTEAQVAGLVEAQHRTETQMETLATRVDGLTSQMTALAAQMAELTRVVRGVTDDTGKLKGLGLETRVRTHSGVFFGELLRRPQVLSSEELSELLDEAVDQGKLSGAEAEEIQWVDLVVQGTRRADGRAVHLVLEVSWTVDADDVERAAHRAALLAKTGVIAQGVVIGETVRSAAAQLALALQVWQVTDKKTVLPTL